MAEDSQKWEIFDEIDKQILDVLSDDPRIPYSKLAEQIADSGYEMSTEGVRYRVSKILETTTVFFLLEPQQLSWEVIRLTITTIDKPDAKKDMFQIVSEMPFWHVSRGIGTYDLFAVGSAPSMNAVDALVTTIQEHEYVKDIEYTVVTERNRDMESYLSMDYLPVSEESGDGSNS
jgi:DNA-binding Lrp family transcriptional regulator